MGLRLISDSLPAVAGKAFKRKYIMLGRLVTHWNDIVGPDLAGKTQPVRLRYYKSRKKSSGEKATASLDIAASSSEATLLHYQKDLILERINRIFGAGWITAIRFVPQEANNSQKRKMPPKVVKSLTEGEKRYLSGVLEAVDDPEIMERLKNMGTAIIQDKRF